MNAYIIVFLILAIVVGPILFAEIFDKIFIFTNDWRIKKIIMKNEGIIEYVPQYRLICNKFGLKTELWRNNSYRFDNINEAKAFIQKQKLSHIDVRNNKEEIISI